MKMRFTLSQILITVLIVALTLALVVNHTRSQRHIQALRRTLDQLLVVGSVVDAETGEPIKSFRVLPGGPWTTYGPWSKVFVCRPHLIREMHDGELKWPRASGYEKEKMRLRIEADGYRPVMTNWTGNDRPQLKLKVHLQRDPGIRGVVLGPDGSPAAGAMLAVALPERTVRIVGHRIQVVGEKPPQNLSDLWRIPFVWESDRDGHFHLTSEIDPSAMLCITHPDGYFELPFVKLVDQARADEELTVTLQRWARIEGEVYWKDRPGAGDVVRAIVHRDTAYPQMIEADPQTEADAEGRYTIEYLPPGSVQVVHPMHIPGTKRSSLHGEYRYPVFRVTLREGETGKIDIGGRGVAVTGRLTGLNSFDEVTLAISPRIPNWREIASNLFVQERATTFFAFEKSDLGKLYWRNDITVAEDGSFRIEDVMTGEYMLWINHATGSNRTFTVASFDGETKHLAPIPFKRMPPPEAAVDVVPNE